MNKRTINTVRDRAHKLNIQADFRHWTVDEIATLKKYYPIEHKDVCKRFPGKAPNSVNNMLRKLHINIRTETYYWTEEEDTILKKYYNYEGALGCSKRLENRSKNACQGRAKYLNLEYLGNWTNEEIKTLYNFYPKLGIKCAKFIPQHSKSAITTKAHELSITFEKAGVRWTPEEDEILKKYYPIEGKDIVNRFTNRDLVSIKNRAFHFRLKAPDIKNKSVLCIETQELFPSCSEASKKYNCRNLSAVVKGKNNYQAGGYHWCYPDNLEAIDLLQKYIGGPRNVKKYIECIELKVIYKNCTEASKMLNISINSINACLLGQQKSAGKLPDGTKLHWRYVDEKDSNK